MNQHLENQDDAYLLELLLQEEGVRQQDHGLTQRIDNTISPLSYAQQRLWTICRMNPDTAAYHIVGALRLAGPLNSAALMTAIRTMATRYDVLRTRFSEQDGEPVAIVDDDAAPCFNVILVPPGTNEAQLENLMEQEADRPMDLEKGPLLRVTLFRQSNDNHLLMMVIHHIIADGWSLGLMISELGVLYAGELKQNPPALPHPRYQYGDYAIWQRQHSDERRMADLTYWKEQLANPPGPNLPTDKPRPMEPDFCGAKLPFTIPAAQSRALMKLAEEEGCTLFMVLISLFFIQLHRYSGSDDIRIGTPVAGRNRPEFESMPGFFVNTLVLRADCSGSPGFRQFLQSVRFMILNGFQHQEQPFDQLVSELLPERDLSSNPLFQVAFSMENAPEGRLELPDLELEPVVMSSRFAKFDLLLVINQTEDDLACELEYATALFHRTTIGRQAQHFQSLIAAAVKNPEKAIDNLTLMSEAEFYRVTHLWNRTTVPFSHKNLIDLFRDQASRTPRATALSFDNEQISYDRLNQRVNRLARFLIQEGVSLETPVGISMDQGAGRIVATLAILAAGGAYVPLDSSYPPQRLARMVADSGLEMMLANQRDEVLFPGVRQLVISEITPAVRRMNPTPLPCPALPENLAYIIFTSGSTGVPKGNAIPQKAVARLVLENRYYVFTESDRVAQLSNFSFDAATMEIWGALLNGGQLVGLDRDTLLSPPDLAVFLREKHITVMFMTVALFNQVSHIAPNAFAFIRCLLVGGESQDPASIRRILNAAPPRRLQNIYGPTEVTTYALSHVVEHLPPEAITVPIGKPISNTTAYICDSKLRLQPIGIPGELLLGGPGLARAYVNQGAATARQFVPDPFGREGSRLYRTGDLVRSLPNGEIVFLGRIDNQVKIRGFRIEPSEVESHLVRHQKVLEAMVLPHADDTGSRRLVAYLVTNEDMDSAEMNGFLAGTLPDYMIPSAFMNLRTFPINANGKVDRKRLLQEHPPVYSEASSRMSPVNEREEVLANVWASTLGVEQVFREDNYFRLGGDSIQAIQVINRLLQAGWTLKIRDLFGYKNLADVAPHMKPTVEQQVEQDVDGPIILSPIQRWFMELYDGHPHFNQSILLQPIRPLNTDRLTKIIACLWRHHDALRLVFPSDGDAYHLPVEPAPEPAVIKVSNPREMARKSSKIKASFNLSGGPLFSVTRFLLPDGERLLLTAHHLIIDGFSWRLILEDLEKIHAMLEQSQAPDAGPKSCSFQAYAKQAQALALSDDMNLHRNYWCAILGRKAMSLTRDAETPDNLFGNRQAARVELNREQTRKVLTDVHQAYHTNTDDLLLTALALAVHRLYGDGGLWITLEHHGRNLFDDDRLNRTVGWFTAMFPFYLDTSDSHPGRQLKRIKESLRQLPGNGAGYGLLRRLSASAELLPEVNPALSFNYLGKFDHTETDHIFRFAGEDHGPDIDAALPRVHDLDMGGLLVDEKLAFWIDYHPGRHKTETVEGLLQGFRDALVELAEFCRNRSDSEKTPSDFTSPVFGLDRWNLILDQWGWQPGRIEDVMALSPLQEGMLFQSLFDTESRAYFVQLDYLIEGNLNEQAFIRSWSRLIQRHPILRTLFVHEGLNHPLQVIFKEGPLPVTREDLSDMNPEARSSHRQQILEQDRRKGFDLQRGPLSRLALYRLDPNRVHVIWSYHHLLLDGWCMGIIFRDWMTLYQAELEGRPDQLPPVVPYSRYIRWLAETDRETSRLWWQNYLEGYERTTGALRFPLEHHAPQEAQGQYIFELDSKTTAALKQQTINHGTTLNTLVQLAWARVLACYNNSDDVLFGAVVSGRPATLPGSEQMVGLFINTLPVRVTFKPEMSLSETLEEMQYNALEAEPHHSFPLAEIQALSSLGAELFDHIMVFENYPIEKEIDNANKSDFRITDVSAFDKTHYSFDITIQPGEEMAFMFNYDLEVYDHQQMVRTAHHLLNALTTLAHNPDAEALFTDNEDRELVAGFNSRVQTNPPHRCFADLFEYNAHVMPEREALVAGDQSLTYRELDDLATLMAGRLQAAGIKPETRVGVCLPRSINLVIAVLAVQKTGGAHVPLDPDYPTDRLNHMMDDAAVSLLITWSGTPLETGSRPVMFTDRPEGEPPPFSDRRPAHPAQLAYMVYTSGSTGLPKGAMVSQKAWLNTCFAYRSDYDLGNRPLRHLQAAGCSFDVFAGDLARALGNGGSLVLVPREHLMDPRELYNLMHHQKIQAVEFVPAVMRPLADVMMETGDRLPHLEVLVVSSDSWDINDYRRFRNLFDNRLQIINSYGVTEAAIDSCWFSDEGILLEGDRLVPIGKPFANTGIHIMDSRLQPQPVGAPGELTIGGLSLGRGYWNKPALTASVFVPDPMGRGTRLYRSGDRARYLPDGNLEFLGRLDFQIKLRGIRMEPGEIENALGLHPRINHCVVGLSGDTDPLLVAWYQDSGTAPDKADLRAFLQQSLTSQMVPTAYVAVTEWPLTGNGKIDHKRLPAPKPEDLATGSIFQAPQTPTEQRLAKIWSRILGTDRIGVNDSFFELGGHSLKAMQITSAVQSEYGVRLPLRHIFDQPTIAAIAPFIDQAQLCEDDSIQPAPPAAHYPLSHTQGRFWLMHHMGGSASLNMSDARMVHSELERPVLEQVFERLMKRHEILRTGFREHKGQPRQFLVPNPPNPLQIFDLTDDPRAEIKAREITAREAARPFIMDQPPLFRPTFIKLSHNRYVFLMTIHHIIGDGWSDNVLYGEMMSLYTLFTRGEADPLPVPRVHFKDYAWREHRLGFEREALLWRKRMPQLPEPLVLPYDHQPEGDRTFAGGSEPLTVGPDIAKPLTALAHEEGILRAHVTLTLVNLLLYKLSGQRDITIGLTMANRNHPDLEQMIGPFVNILPTQLSIDENLSFRELLLRADADASEALEGQSYPLDLLVRDLNPSRRQARQSLFNVVLTYANFEDLNLAVWEDPEQRDGEQEEAETEFEVNLETANFDLIFLVNDQGDGLRIDLNYDTDLFDSQSIRRYLNAFQRFARLAGEDPSRPVSSFSLLDPSQDSEVLQKLSAPGEPDPVITETIHQRFARIAAGAPQAPAVFDETTTLTYARVNEAAENLALALRESGLGIEDVVALRMEPSPQVVVAMLAVLKAGGVYLPLDPSQPMDRAAWQINNTSATMVVFDPAWFDEAFELSASCPRLERVFEMDADCSFTDMVFGETGKTASQPVTGPDHLAYVVYTSGSTGQAKGVMIPHRGVMRICLGGGWREPETERFVQAGSLSFDAATLEIWRPLLNGGACGFPRRQTILDPTALHAFIEQKQITTMFLTTQLFNRIADNAPDLFGALQQVHTGGEKVSTTHVNSIRQRHPQLELFHVYGPTENTVYSTRYRVTELHQNDVPIGEPIPGTATWLLDESFQPVFQGVTGELCTGGDGLARGYLGRPDLTAQVMVPNPFGNGTRLYRTGDLAVWQQDGELVFRGRRDNQVKIRGHRIEPAEVERYLTTMDSVGQAVVLARKGSGGMELAAWLTLAGGMTVARVREQLAGVLPDYMIPSMMTPVKTIPLNANGKVDKTALPEPVLYERENERELPRNETEETLLGIWQKVLERQDVGVTDNFFDVGGHSLALVNLSSLITDRMGEVLALSEVFHKPTIRQQADFFMDRARFGSDMADNAMALLSGDPQAPPLFAFPPGTGDAIGFLPLSELLREVAFYGFTFIQAESRITDYANLVQKHQKQGPPVLMGYSSGGNLAYHVAVELERRGCTPPVIIMLDSERRRECFEYSEEDVESVIRDFLEEPGIQPYLTSGILRDKVRRQIRSSFQWYAETTDHQMVEATIHLIMEENPDSTTDAEDWGRLTRGTYQTHQGAGAHNTMLWKENLGANAAIIRRILLQHRD